MADWYTSYDSSHLEIKQETCETPVATFEPFTFVIFQESCRIVGSFPVIALKFLFVRTPAAASKKLRSEMLVGPAELV